MNKCIKCGTTISDNDPMSWKCMSCGKAFNVNLSKLKRVKVQKNKPENAGKILLKCPFCGNGMDNGNEKIVYKCSACGNINGGNLEYFFAMGKVLVLLEKSKKKLVTPKIEKETYQKIKLLYSRLHSVVLLP